MLILRNHSLIPETCKGAVIALGNFDGLHRGHQEVIHQTVTIAHTQHKPAAILTFEPHPRRVFRPDLPVLRLISFYEKARLLQDAGIDYMRVIRFTRDFAATTAATFIEKILLQELGASHIVTGDDFVFGHNREGNTNYLAQMAAAKGFGYTMSHAVEINGRRSSSTTIREMLAAGNIEEANSMLGRPWSFTGIVRQGDQRGRQLGFPTANLVPAGIFLPASGVYAVRVHWKDRVVYGVANLGNRPTFADTRLQLEVHILDFAEMLYGQHLKVDFLHYIRPEQKFNGLEGLKAQIAQDARKAGQLMNIF